MLSRKVHQWHWCTHRTDRFIFKYRIWDWSKGKDGGVRSGVPNIKLCFFYSTQIVLVIQLRKIPKTLLIIFWSFKMFFIQICFSSVRLDLTYSITNSVYELLEEFSNNLTCRTLKIRKYSENLNVAWKYSLDRLSSSNKNEYHKQLWKLFESYILKISLNIQVSLNMSLNWIYKDWTEDI